MVECRCCDVQWAWSNSIDPRVTHRNIGQNTSTFGSPIWSNDLGTDLSPTGSQIIRAVSSDSDRGPLVTWIATTRVNSITAYRVNPSSGQPDGTTYDHGADLRSLMYSVVFSPSSFMIGGDPGTGSNTLRLIESDGTTVWSNALLATRVNFVYGLSADDVGEERGLACGVGVGKSVVAVDLVDGAEKWNADPTSGSGEAVWLTQAAGSTIGGAPPGGAWVLFDGITAGNDNVFSIDESDASGGMITGAFDIRSGEVNTCMMVTGVSIFLDKIIICGETDGSNTITAYDILFTNSIIWEADTGSTVRSITYKGLGLNLLVVGDRNASGKSAWIIDTNDGTILDSLDHGDDLLATDTVRYIQALNVVAGERV